MTNAITEAREDIKEALELIEGFKVFDYVPATLRAPAAVVTPGSPYVVPGQVLGEFRVALNIRLFAKHGTNEVITKALDDMIVNVCLALKDFGVVSVAAPGVDKETYDTPYLVTDITLNTTYKGDS